MVAIANAVIAGVVVANTLHEWGHLAGARLSGSVSPMMEKPVRHFFIFDFSFDKKWTGMMHFFMLWVNLPN